MEYLPVSKFFRSLDQFVAPCAYRVDVIRQQLKRVLVAVGSGSHSGQPQCLSCAVMKDNQSASVSRYTALNSVRERVCPVFHDGEGLYCVSHEVSRQAWTV